MFRGSSFGDIINSLCKPKNYLALANVFLILFLIIFNNIGVLPMRTGDFFFFSFLILAFALYRPGWAFLFFIGTLPLENINLAPVQWGMALRPYQFLGFLVILALAIRFFSKRLDLEFTKFQWFDYFPVIFAAASFLSFMFSGNKTASLKMFLIVATCVAFYFLVRNYIQNKDDLRRVVPFFLSSSFIVVAYGIWQNWRFVHGATGFEFMPGRPNATFMEPDWLGAYLVIVISAVFVMLYYFQTEAGLVDRSEISISDGPSGAFLYVLLVLSFILLILTVSRSAWLAVFASLVIFLYAVFTDLSFHYKNWHWKETVRIKIKILISLLASIALVYVFHLTNFQLGNRVQSAGSGLQKITISCDPKLESGSPEADSGTFNEKELEKYGCRQINLEEIDQENALGRHVTEVYREDPNVNARSRLFKLSWNAIKEHPVLGIGWGSIGPMLGTDGNGNYYNSSNVFLETWLGAGLAGLLALVVLLIVVVSRAITGFCFGKTLDERTISLFILSGWFGLVIFNLFNAGLFLGFLWVWLAIANYESS